MVLPITSKLNVRATSVFILIVALTFTHLDLLIDGLPKYYFFPFSAFTINVFYTGLGLYIFWEITALLEKIAWLQDKLLVRTIFLLFFSMLCYLLLQMAIIYYFEPTFNQNYLSFNQMQLTFGFGLLAVCLVNSFHFLYHAQETEQKTREGQKEKTLIEGTWKGQQIAINPSLFSFFIADSGLVFGIDEAHKKVILKTSLLTLEKQLPQNLYYRINRNYIVKKDCINLVHLSSKNAFIHLNGFPEKIDVSRRRVVGFRKWLEK